MKDLSYLDVMEQKNEIMKKAVGIDYQRFELSPLAFDYEKMMKEVGYSLERIRQIQKETGVGQTPLLELKNITKLVRKTSPPGYGARIFLKDEACNPSGSYKARRASVSVYHAEKHGYPGVVAATSGNYGAAVASQAAMRGLQCIVVQEVYDSTGLGQPEIIEKGRKCEAYGAEVVQLTVGPELFFMFLKVLQETGYFNASLYTPFGIAGIETLGVEIVEEIRQREGQDPDAIVIAHAGGGNVTGTARGIQKLGANNTKIIGASVDLQGLHMASDRDFNRKSFTTGHTGFGMPFATWPDRADVPRNAARALRYLDRYVTISQGEVFYVTEALAQLEGLERGPAGNTSLAAAIALAREMPAEQILVVQETEYTGAGKHPTAQLTLAIEQGIEVRRGDPHDDLPGQRIIIPKHPSQIQITEVDLGKVRQSYLNNALKKTGMKKVSKEELVYLAAEIKSSEGYLRELLSKMGVEIQ